MAKFCGECGMQLDDDARVCGRCGTPVDKEIPIPGPNPNKLKKKIKIMISFIIVAIIAVIAFNIASSFIGSKGLVRKVMKAYKNYDIQGLMSLSSDMYYYGSEDESQMYFENSVGSDQDEYEEKVGHSYRLSYDINEIYDLSERRQDEMLDSIEYTYPDFDVDTISKISVASLNVTVKQGKKSITRNVNITMSKEGKDWKLLYID